MEAATVQQNWFLDFWTSGYWITGYGNTALQHGPKKGLIFIFLTFISEFHPFFCDSCGGYTYYLAGWLIGFYIST